MTELSFVNQSSAPAHDLAPTWSLLGLPVQTPSLEQAVSLLQRAAAEGEQLFLSTPNVNFLATSYRSESFYKSLLASDLSVVDGAPLVWLGRFLGLPIPERVAGASLLEKLTSSSQPAPGNLESSFFFFGGDGDVARRACLALNSQCSSSVSCAGYLNPGFGDVQSMSTPDVLDTINASDADFLVVSLGAEKGQAWIMHNLTHLKPRVVSHLGAAVNFLASDVKRAPRWLQAVGGEWLWRIKEQPALIKRYWGDGLLLLRLVVMAVLPYALWLRRNRWCAKDALHYSVDTGEQKFTLKLTGSLSVHTIAALAGLEFPLHTQSISLDLENVSYVDARGVGWLLELQRLGIKQDKRISIVVCNPTVRRILSWNRMTALLAE